MKIKSKYIYIILFIFLTCIISYVLFYHKSNLKIDNNVNNTYENSVSIDTRINNNPTKIKIGKLNEKDETPFVCFVSDEYNITKLENFLNSIGTEELNFNDEFNPIYDITFYGDFNIIISLSSDKIIQIEKENKNTKRYYKVSDTTFNNIIDLLNIKYYLHQSNLPEPMPSICKNANKIILSGMSNTDIDILKRTIHNVHSSLEYHLVERVQIIKNANSIYWEPEIKNEIFTQPNGEKVQSSGLWEYRDSLQNIKELEINDDLKTIIEDVLFRLEQGMNNHDISECFEVHKILHDLDYWIINYPISSFKIAPADWSGINCYYRSIEKYSLY